MLCIVKKTLDTTVETQNHYVVCVKKNQHKLYSLMQDNTENKELNIDTYTQTEMNRGRLEHRSIGVFNVSQEIKHRYPHSKNVILVKRETIRKDKLTEETVYYLSDLTLSSKEFYKGIRGHWSIENKLHYVKDVVMNEDRANLKNKLIAPILSIFRSFVISIANFFSYSVTSFQRTFAHDIELLTIF